MDTGQISASSQGSTIHVGARTDHYLPSSPTFTARPRKRLPVGSPEAVQDPFTLFRSSNFIPKPKYSSVQDNLDASLHYLTAAAAAEETPIKKKSLLDFLNIFREYTEEGKVNYASSALISNIQNLETITRKLNKAAATSKQQSPPRPIQSSTPQEKSYAAAAATAAGANPTLQANSVKQPRKQGSPIKTRKSRRLVLSRPLDCQTIAPMQARDTINKALQAALGLKGPFVASLSPSFSGKTVIVTATE